MDDSVYFFPLKLVLNECGVVTRGPKDRPTLFLELATGTTTTTTRIRVLCRYTCNENTESERDTHTQVLGFGNIAYSFEIEDKIPDVIRK